ncbi:MAG: FAD-dependent oxidoreductase [Alcanivorax sp.]|nr:FAD-dependent oxidoreductase [Alcanivorax sp.]MBI55495.1 FAD-dependent oxidoreductase [Alcanivorax sp.]MBU58022.1 FAD-dependent oxidoreductase [Alcanivorax sp.]HCE40601.1 FAD-dependent oxidoreductase [Alcanivorax sp.]
MPNWDVIVAGAGQAGCAAAWDLAAGGARVLLLHGGPERPKPCAGGLTIKALRRYRFPLDAVIRERVDRVAMSRSGEPPVTAGAAAPFCVMTHRRELDALCREQARARGAGWHVTAGVRAVRQDHQGVTLISAEGETLRATWLIAADGAHSPVRRALQGQPPAAPAMALEGHLPRERARRYPPMTLDFQEVPGGYGWLFPKGDHINVGLYVWRRDRARLAREHLADYARRTLGSDALEEVGGYPLGTWLARRPPRCGRVLFVGDAAGSTEPLLGEGIYGALVSGQLAAGALLAGRLRDYPLLLADWGEELRQVERITRIFYGVPALGYAALSRWLAPTLLAGYAEGLTLGGTKRAWRSLKGRRHLLGSPGA